MKKANKSLKMVLLLNCMLLAGVTFSSCGVAAMRSDNNQFFGQGFDQSFGQGFDQSLGRVSNQSFGQGSNQFFGQGFDQSLGRVSNQSFGQGSNQFFGQGFDQSLGRVSNQSFGQGSNQFFGQGFDQSLGRVSNQSFGQDFNKDLAKLGLNNLPKGAGVNPLLGQIIPTGGSGQSSTNQKSEDKDFNKDLAKLGLNNLPKGAGVNPLLGQILPTRGSVQSSTNQKSEDIDFNKISEKNVNLEIKEENIDVESLKKEINGIYRIFLYVYTFVEAHLDSGKEDNKIFEEVPEENASLDQKIKFMYKFSSNILTPLSACDLGTLNEQFGQKLKEETLSSFYGFLSLFRSDSLWNGSFRTWVGQASGIIALNGVQSSNRNPRLEEEETNACYLELCKVKRALELAAEGFLDLEEKDQEIDEKKEENQEEIKEKEVPEHIDVIGQIESNLDAAVNKVFVEFKNFYETIGLQGDKLVMCETFVKDIDQKSKCGKYHIVKLDTIKRWIEKLSALFFEIGRSKLTSLDRKKSEDRWGVLDKIKSFAGNKDAMFGSFVKQIEENFENISADLNDLVDTKRLGNFDVRKMSCYELYEAILKGIELTEREYSHFAKGFIEIIGKISDKIFSLRRTIEGKGSFKEKNKITFVNNNKYNNNYREETSREDNINYYNEEDK